jgi:predicted ATP-grasp superfamily ATP-dependent carboligase
MRRVALFDADAPGSLAFLTSLGTRGVPVDVYSHMPWPPARASRFCSRFERCPDLFDLEAFLPWLKGRVDAGQIQLIAPTSDLVAFCIAEVCSRLPEQVQAAYPAPAQTLDALFKDRFELEHGRVRTPPTFAPASLEEGKDRAAELDYPVVVKPRSHVATPWARGGVARSPGELRDLMVRYDVHPGARGVVERFAGLDLPLTQTLVDGARFTSVSGALLDDRPVAASACVKTAQWPPDTGVGVIFRSERDPALVAEGAAAAAAALGSGIFELELVDDAEADTLWAIDLNPRAHGQVRLDVARGYDLPWLWAQAAFGETPAPPEETRDDLEWRHSVLLGLGRTFDLAFGPRREAARALADRTPWVDIVLDKRDPRAGALYLYRMARHPRGLLRPFVKKALGR